MSNHVASAILVPLILFTQKPYLMLVFKPYREESRKNWGTNIEENVSINKEQIQLGCLLRIADATEAMAKTHIALQRDYDWMKHSRDSYKESYETILRKYHAQKGVITKLKKKLNPKPIIE